MSKQEREFEIKTHKSHLELEIILTSKKLNLHNRNDHTRLTPIKLIYLVI